MSYIDGKESPFLKERVNELKDKNEELEYSEVLSLEDKWFVEKISLDAYIEASYEFYRNCGSPIWRFYAVEGLGHLKLSSNERVAEIMEAIYVSDPDKIVRNKALYLITYLYKHKLKKLINYVLEHETCSETIAMAIISLRNNYNIKIKLEEKKLEEVKKGDDT